MSTSRVIAANTLYQIIGKVISLGVTVLATAIITRYYGVEGYGAFSLMQNWPALFFVIADFGINAIAVRELTLDWSKAGKYLGTIMLFRLVFSFVLIVLLAFAMQFFPYTFSLKTGIILALFLIATQALFTTLNIFFQVKQRYDLSVIGYVSGYALILVLVLLFSFFHVDVMWVSFSYVIGGILTFLVNLLLVKKLGVTLIFTYDADLIKKLLVSALPLGLMFIFSQVNFKIDSIFLSVLNLPKKIGLSAEESLGIYGLPYKIFEVALVVPTFFMNAVYPVLVTHMSQGKEKLWKTFKKVMFVLFGAGVLSGAVGILFSTLAVDLLGGPEFNRSVLVLRILLAGMVLYFMTQPISWLIVTLDKQSYLPWIYLLSAIFNVTSNLIFIPRFSFYASSVITHVSELLILLMLIYAARRAWKEKYA